MDKQCSIKEIKTGDCIKARTHMGVVEVTDIRHYGSYSIYSFIDMQGTVASAEHTIAQPVELTDRPAGMDGVRVKHWPQLIGYSGYKTFNGADPEVFVTDEKGVVIPAWEFLPSKQVAKQTHTNHYWDGFQAEFTMRPSPCLNIQNDYMSLGLGVLLHLARRKFPKAQLSIQNTVDVPLEMLLTAAEEHVTFGCQPSLNAYGLQGEEIANPRLLKHRFAGGHIHKGWKGLTEIRAREVVKALDALVAVPCVTMFEKLDNPIRRKFYGLPGEHRLPVHGLEYRVLSNAWMSHPAIAQFVRETFRLVSGLAQVHMENVFDYQEAEVVDIILNHDVDGAKKLVKRNLSNYTKLYKLAHWEGKPTQKGLHLLQNSVTEFIDPLKFEQNWRFGSWVSDSGLPEARWRTFAELS